MLNKKILSSALVVTIAAAAFVSGTTAYFSDTETSADNVLQAGAIDLKIDNHSYYNGVEWGGTTWGMADLDDGNGPADGGKYLFFDFHDLKPGDWGEDTISAHITNNNSWLCMDVNVTETSENGITEPESKVDQTPEVGELQDFVKFVFWADDGDNVLETDEYIFVQDVTLGNIGTIALADSTVNGWETDIVPLTGSDDLTQAYYIGKAWCFGDLTLEPLTPGDSYNPARTSGVLCNGANTDNSTQTDSVLADVSFTAVQSRHNGSYRCVGCEIDGEGWASSVYAWNPGHQKDTDPLPTERSDPTQALGAPDGPAIGSFVSLGFGGSIVLEMPSYITSEVTAVEVTWYKDNDVTSYPEEKAEVYVSGNGTDFTWVGTAYNHSAGGATTIDVSGTTLSEIRYVKLVDSTDPAVHPSGDADGFDLDAVGAVVCLDEVEPR